MPKPASRHLRYWARLLMAGATPQPGVPHPDVCRSRLQCTSRLSNSMRFLCSERPSLYSSKHVTPSSVHAYPPHCSPLAPSRRCSRLAQGTFHGQCPRSPAVDNPSCGHRHAPGRPLADPSHGHCHTLSVDPSQPQHPFWDPFRRGIRTNFSDTHLVPI